MRISVPRCPESVQPGRPADTVVQVKEVRYTALGAATYIRIYTPDYRQLSWSEIWATFADAYPGLAAVQIFPPAERLVDEQNIYHLFVLDEIPRGFDIKR